MPGKGVTFTKEGYLFITVTLMLWYSKSQTTDFFDLECVHARTKIKALHYWPFVRGIYRWLINSLHKRLVMQKCMRVMMSPCLGDILKTLWRIKYHFWTIHLEILLMVDICTAIIVRYYCIYHQKLYKCWFSLATSEWWIFSQGNAKCDTMQRMLLNYILKDYTAMSCHCILIALFHTKDNNANCHLFQLHWWGTYDLTCLSLYEFLSFKVSPV